MDTPPTAATPLFDAPLARPRRRRRGVVAALAAVALLAAGATAVAARGDDDPGLRTATTAVRSVDQVLHGVATVEAVSQARVAFPVAGTVATVDVAVGDQVAVGRRLATLDEAALVTTLHEREATLAEARLTLERALAGEPVDDAPGGPGTDAATGTGAAGTGATGTGAATPASAPTGSTGATAATTVPAARPTTTTGDDTDLRAAQRAVVDAQAAASRALRDAQAAVDAALAVCGDLTSTPTSTSTPSTTTTVAGATTTTTTADAGADVALPDDDGTATCAAALGEGLTAQQEAARRQAEVSTAADALTALLAERAATAAGTGGTGGTGGGTASSSADPSGRAGSSDPSSSTRAGTGSAAATTTETTAERLIALQKAVDAAEAEVAVASQAIEQASIVSPIAGTVVAVGLAVGDDVTAAATDAAITVVGDGGYEVTTTVSVGDLGDLAVGQAATVRPDGSGDALRGEVVAIGLAGEGSGSATSYPVTIGLDEPDADLGNGATASVEIVTDAVTDVLAVPTSAVTVDGERATVRRVGDDGEAAEVTVTTGAIGATWTEVTSGLDAGDEVVLADLGEPLPSSATEVTSSGSTRTFGGGGGGRGGAGFGGGPMVGPPG